MSIDADSTDLGDDGRFDVRPGRQAQAVGRGAMGPGSGATAVADRPTSRAPNRHRPGRRGRCSLPAARGASVRRTWSLNLAIALGEMGQRVVVVDADIGLANLDLLCGLAPRYDLGDVLAGRCRWSTPW